MLLNIGRNIILLFLLALLAGSTQHVPTLHAQDAIYNKCNETADFDNSSTYELQSIPFGQALLINNSNVGFTYNFPSFERRESQLHLLNIHFRRTKQALIVFYNIQLTHQSAREMQGYYLYALCKMLI